jgi:hypothetical protein
MLSIKLSENGGKAPQAVPYMPAGQHFICATVNGQPGKRTVIVDKAACDRLQEDLQEHLRASAAGKKARPMVMFDHSAGAAAAKPLRFVWDDKKGILLEVEWTQAGREAVEGGNYGYISPAFRLARGTGVIQGLAPGVEVGSLVNDPAFEKNECIAASREEDTEWVSAAFLPPRGHVENREFPGDNKAVATEGGVNNERKKDMEEINKLLGLAPDADTSAVYSAIEALKKKAEADKAKTDEISAECETHKKALADHREKTADAFIARLKKNGNIPPKDEVRINAARKLYMDDPEAAEIVFCSMKPSHAVSADEDVRANRLPVTDTRSAAEILQAEFEANL